MQAGCAQVLGHSLPRGCDPSLPRAPARWPGPPDGREVGQREEEHMGLASGPTANSRQQGLMLLGHGRAQISQISQLLSPYLVATTDDR